MQKIAHRISENVGLCLLCNWEFWTPLNSLKQGMFISVIVFNIKESWHHKRIQLYLCQKDTMTSVEKGLGKFESSFITCGNVK
jgi:hypothetical protein